MTQKRDHNQTMQDFRLHKGRQLVAIAAAVLLTIFLALLHNRPDLFGQIPKKTILATQLVTRQRAMAACDFLMQQLWHEVELEFHWWGADFLAHAIMADAAAKQAVRADFLIFCSEAEQDCSPTIKNWFESWIEDRHGRDGLLLNLSAARGLNAGIARPVESFLRGVARRATLDYCDSTSPAPFGTLPASFEEAERRACEICRLCAGRNSASAAPPAQFRA